MQKVFLIDDDQFLTKLYGTLFRNEGFTIGVANSGDDAIEQLPGFGPDLVVLDLHMPGVSGVEVLRFIRNQTALKDVPVVVFSNGYIQSLLDEVGELRTKKVLSKLLCPPNQLVREVKDVLATLPPAAPETAGRSALEEAASHAREESLDQLPIWLTRLRTDSRQEARRVCLIHIYRVLETTIQRAVTADASTQRGKLGRALKKLLDDLFDHPGHITESTMKALDHSTQKLICLCAKTHNAKLESESALMDVLADFDD